MALINVLDFIANSKKGLYGLCSNLNRGRATGFQSWRNCPFYTAAAALPIRPLSKKKGKIRHLHFVRGRIGRAAASNTKWAEQRDLSFCTFFGKMPLIKVKDLMANCKNALYGLCSNLNRGRSTAARNYYKALQKQRHVRPQNGRTLIPLQLCALKQS